MRSGITKAALLSGLMILSNAAFSQTAESSGGSATNYLIYTLVTIAVLIFFYLVINVADNLLAIEAKQSGAAHGGQNLSIMPGVKDILTPRLPAYVGDGTVTVLRRGFDILLDGEAEQKIVDADQVKTFAVQPPNFRGIAPIPKMLVEEGAEVKAGDALFYDKNNPDIKYVAPVSGEVIAINRGEKRAITEVVILADKEQKYRQFEAFDLEKESRAALVAYLMEAGVWPLILQRPFNIVADPNETPRDIFISTFDTAPLAPDLNFVVAGREAHFQRGLDVLGRLTSGKVYLGLNARPKTAPAAAFMDATGVERRWFHGKHPAGNVGVQIHHIAPIGPRDKVWTLGVQDVITIGALFNDRTYQADRIVALTGAELKNAHYVRTRLGANIGELLQDNLANDHVRFISGDVLSGQQKDKAGFINASDDQLTVVEEGDYFEMFGWLLPIKPRPSISLTFPNFLWPRHKFHANTNTHGEKRAFVVTGEYESVLPMDIYPQHLMKSILVNDIERMEGLGIYELVEEDVALCEFACTSKQPLQQILRQGLDLMHEQS